MKTKKQPVNEQKDTMAMNEHQGWHFLYWDDYPDTRTEEEKAAEKRMLAILQNGNNGEHYEQNP